MYSTTKMHIPGVSTKMCMSKSTFINEHSGADEADQRRGRKVNKSRQRLSPNFAHYEHHGHHLHETTVEARAHARCHFKILPSQ